jgi:hypothetical protein
LGKYYYYFFRKFTTLLDTANIRYGYENTALRAAVLRDNFERRFFETIITFLTPHLTGNAQNHAALNYFSYTTQKKDLAQILFL